VAHAQRQRSIHRLCVLEKPRVQPTGQLAHRVKLTIVRHGQTVSQQVEHHAVLQLVVGGVCKVSLAHPAVLACGMHSSVMDRHTPGAHQIGVVSALGRRQQIYEHAVHTVHWLVCQMQRIGPSNGAHLNLLGFKRVQPARLTRVEF
jgi:hypothetical protein